MCDGSFGARAQKRVVGVGRGAHEKRHDCLMLVDGKRLGEKISEVVGTWAPLDIEVLLLDAIPHPMKAHVDGLGSLGLDGVCRQADCTSVIAEHDGGGLHIP